MKANDLKPAYQGSERRHDEATTPCLVVAASESRRMELWQAARSAGWIPIRCSDVPSAVMHYEKTFLRLVIVDLHTHRGHRATEFRSLLEWFAAKGCPAIVICGHEGDVQEEIWARQLGPWLYLTGSISASELSDHLRVARQQAIHHVLAELPD